MNRRAYLGIALVMFFAPNALSYAEQWSGSQTTTGDIHRTGKVGIGTSSPQDLIHLYRNSASTSGILMGNSTVPSGRRGFLVDYHSSGGAELWNFENTDMWFATNGNRRMTIKNNGRVGIGTASPEDVLHLFRTSAVTTGVLMGNSLVPAGRRGFLVNFHASGGAELWNFENSDMWFGTNNSKKMTLRKDGRLAINTLSQDWGFDFNDNVKLDVAGMVRVSQVSVWDGPGEYDLTWARGCHEPGSTTVCGYLEGTRMITREGSSRRYKENIRPVRSEDFAKILAAQAMQYEPKENHGPKGWSTIGYIAEDLEKAGLQDLVIYDEEGKPDGVKYKKVAVYVNEVVKAQQKTIEQLQAEIAEMKRRLDAMTAGKK